MQIIFSLLERLSNTRDSSTNKTSTPINTLSHLRIVSMEKKLGKVIKGKKNIDTSQMTLLKFYGTCYFWEVEWLQLRLIAQRKKETKQASTSNKPIQIDQPPCCVKNKDNIKV